VDYEISQRQETLREEAVKFIQAEFPRDLPPGWMKAFLPKVNRANLLGIAVDRRYGGQGHDFLTAELIVEAIGARDWFAAAMVTYLNSLVIQPLALGGSEAQKKKWLVPALKGELLSAYALTEPDAGSDAAALKASAELRGSEWILNGRKIFITSADEAEYCVIFARTDPPQAGHPSSGISAFFVETGQLGYQVLQRMPTMGLEGSPTCELRLENVRAPADNLLGKRGAGFEIAMRALNVGRIGVGGTAIGASDWAIRETIGFLKGRQQFGQPLSEFQGIRFTITDLKCELEGARQIVRRAAWKLGQGKNGATEVAMAKLVATELAVKIGIECQRLMGGYGYLRSQQIERMVRDCIAFSIYEGTSNVQRLTIAKELFDRC